MTSGPPYGTGCAYLERGFEQTMVADIGDRELARMRQSVIMANADLRERELIKLASMSAALADRLRQRGIGDFEASLAAETSIVVFRVAFSRWVGTTEEQGLQEVIHETLDRLRTLTASS
ncbi:hypothetical protein [Streptomyces shenzhenensis]|uniref:MftR C-terminal domain-containing protein n=1 Tax=Streptomyces shenzhenensis TaxID=943815 RepID=A0A3M0IF87_9ACTN|nr:hypothetical protein [Streptomyces shenzhenensis]RMB86710.1 hypothetical protein CTZ28_06570 [Streptomyces shenzhenensis]